MKLIGMTNVQLSHLVNVDASLVSRYRSGIRSPKSNPQMKRTLSSLLFERIYLKEKQEEFALLSKIPIPHQNRESMESWLFQDSESNDLMIKAARQLLYSMDSFVLPSQEAPVDVTQLIRKFTGNTPDSVYRGYSGLQTACLRFLSEVVKNHASDIWLYSDGNTSWMTEDAEFRSL